MLRHSLSSQILSGYPQPSLERRIVGPIYPRDHILYRFIAVEVVVLSDEILPSLVAASHVQP